MGPTTSKLSHRTRENLTGHCGEVGTPWSATPLTKAVTKSADWNTESTPTERSGCALSSVSLNYRLTNPFPDPTLLSGDVPRGNKLTPPDDKTVSSRRVARCELAMKGNYITVKVNWARCNRGLS